MNNYSAVLVIDESQHESTLVASVIALHAATVEVRAVPNIGAALRYLDDLGAAALAPCLVILGRQALHEAEKLVASMRGDQRLPLVVIGLAADLGSAVKECALAAGVRAIHDRPAGWADYRDTVKAILQDWLVRV
jgi:hypothetical protein